MEKKLNRPWRHPAHARVKTQRFEPRGGALLTDKKIDEYSKRGWYGLERQRAVLERSKKKKPKKAKPLALALRLLNSTK